MIDALPAPVAPCFFIQSRPRHACSHPDSRYITALRDMHFTLNTHPSVISVCPPEHTVQDQTTLVANVKQKYTCAIYSPVPRGVSPTSRQRDPQEQPRPRVGRSATSPNRLRSQPCPMLLFLLLCNSQRGTNTCDARASRTAPAARCSNLRTSTVPPSSGST
ncbi:hypothetical protein CONPUDRAFT_80892 [Coniophora puteana RWD-64-598 SS2]|uniref:Uncharacterized protein n=1 Tax=Coniophora puteana (strain RWD-64-598) TaxID=741705 RepID=A0A5M3MV62_CONPW|nr:uncharacterized protein CONPUDRAFT_80892 [Coniophora puteana RWD-64-598 SS2]EIW82605.1 hypothetical protein CONPUDRAFT_80892 [Coniophora puteana RWD-64-598 SS2]